MGSTKITYRRTDPPSFGFLDDPILEDFRICRNETSGFFRLFLLVPVVVVQVRTGSSFRHLFSVSVEFVDLKKGFNFNLFLKSLFKLLNSTVANL